MVQHLVGLHPEASVHFIPEKKFAAVKKTEGFVSV